MVRGNGKVGVGKTFSENRVFGVAVVGPFCNCEFVQATKQRLFELHAELCGMMANPKRLAILETLHSGEKSVSSIAESLGASISTVSQHLRLLRDKNVVVARKEGQTVFYSLRDPRMVDACNLIRSVLLDGIVAQGHMAVSEFGLPAEAQPEEID